MPSSAPMVTTPVPPTPVTTIPYGSFTSGHVGTGPGTSGITSDSMPAPFFNAPPSTVTKLGQKPFRHEKSLLQDDWSICRLVPNSVSTGTTERQNDWSLQSPQP